MTKPHHSRRVLHSISCRSCVEITAEPLSVLLTGTPAMPADRLSCDAFGHVLGCQLPHQPSPPSDCVQLVDHVAHFPHSMKKPAPVVGSPETGQTGSLRGCLARQPTPSPKCTNRRTACKGRSSRDPASMVDTGQIPEFPLTRI